MRASMSGAIMAIALAALLAVSGCATTSAPPRETVSAQLEQTVLVITQAVAAEDWGAADRDLDVLEGQVDTALAAGELTQERADEIRAAIALVRADVMAGIELTVPSTSPEPTETPEPTGSPDKNDEESDKPGNRGGNRDKDDD